ncbi:MAG: response regulator [bacterium]|nr:response regulator [bacterium]
MKILLVDDDERVRKTLRIHITKAGHVLHEADNGQDGWSEFQNSVFDLVLCDIRMPRLNGIELVKLIRQINPRVPVVMLSGFMESTVVEEALAAGATDYLSKPVQKSELLGKIDQCCSSHEI